MRSTLRRLLEGREPGAASLALRGLLSPLGLAYGAFMRARRHAYGRDWLGSTRAGLPVVSVGNLTVGGTGKTPFTCMLCRRLLAAGRRPAVLSRGYGARDPEQADEVLLLRRLLPQVPVLAGGDRAALARQVTRERADILVLDDGFQHLRLRRDLDVVLLDATCPWGGGLPLPAGMLREFPSALGQAHLICLTHTDTARRGTPGAVEDLEQWLGLRYPDKPVLLGEHRPRRLLDLAGREYPLDDIAGISVLALSGIALPGGFLETLAMLGAEVVRSVALADHHAYAAGEALACLEQADRLGAQLVTTSKDAVKLLPLLGAGQRGRVRVVEIELVLTRGGDELDRRLLGLGGGA